MANIDAALKATVDFVKLDQLYFDPNNYRLIDQGAYKTVKREDAASDMVQRRTLEMLRGGKSNEGLRDLLDSFRINGYMPVDQIQVRLLDGKKEKEEENKYLVIEGNRRTAALKVLKEEYEERGIELGKFNADVFEKIPVVLYEGDEDEVRHLVVMGLKHISGNKKWGEWNQAMYLKRLQDSGRLTEDEICLSVGITKELFRRNLRALSLIEQYKESDYGDQFKDDMFPIFREVVYRQSIKTWLDWDENTRKAKNTANLERLFALISTEIHIDDDGNRTEIFPAITKRDEIRILSEFINDDAAVKRLEVKRDIVESYNASSAGKTDREWENRQDLLDKIYDDAVAISNITLDNDDCRSLQTCINRLQTIVDKRVVNEDYDRDDYICDKTDKHFSQISVDEYKGVSGLMLDNLERINIIAGNNNSGKTSLLEAVYLLCKQNDYSGLREAVRLRSKERDSGIRAKWFLEQVPDKTCISGVYDDKNCNVRICRSRDGADDFSSMDYAGSVRLDAEFAGHKQDATAVLFMNKETEVRGTSPQSICRTVLSSPFFLNEPYRYSKFYNKAVEVNLITKAEKFLQKHLVPTLSTVRLVGDEQRFRVADSAYLTAMDLCNYGEGVQRVFYLSLLFASAQNGVLLIDEFENAIHVSLLENCAVLMNRLSKEFNVQLFLTSHSRECIDAFINNVEDIDDVSCYGLARREDGSAVAQYVRGEDYRFLLNAADADLRKMEAVQ